jgi:hypothetical protein
MVTGMMLSRKLLFGIVRFFDQRLISQVIEYPLQFVAKLQIMVFQN